MGLRYRQPNRNPAPPVGETMTHTPGPWLIKELDSNGNCLIKVGGSTVAKACYLGGTEPAKANARLISAAPELLAEAIELLRNAVYRDGQAIVLTKDCEALEAAIQKAEGKS